MDLHPQHFNISYDSSKFYIRPNFLTRRGILENKKRIQRIYPWAFGFLFLCLCLTISSLSWGESLVSNVDGKIHVIILHYGDGSWGTFWHEPSVFMKDLMDKMDDDVGFVVLVGKDQAAEKAQEIFKPCASLKLPDGTPRVKFLTVDVKTSDFYPWARDGYLILSDEDGNLTFLDVGFGRKPFPITNFKEVFKDATALAGVIHRGGGNIRTTDNEMIIGMDTMLGITIPSRGSFFNTEGTVSRAGQMIKPEDVPQFRERFEAYCLYIKRVLTPDKKMVIPGKEDFFAFLEKGEFPFEKQRVWHTGAQAAYHTDVYLGLGHVDEEGKRVIFIADSKLGAKVVEDMAPEARRELERKLPRILEAEGFTASGIPVTAEQIAERFQWDQHKLLDKCLESVEKAAEKLDKSALRMKELGYRIVRIPYLPNGLTSEDFSTDTMGISFNYSNVLTEVYDNVRKVYMPEYGFDELDNAARQAYEEAGFQVIRIKGYVTHALSSVQDGAGLDCLTSEIRHPVRWTDKYYQKKEE